MRLLFRLLALFSVFCLIANCSPIEKRDDIPDATAVDDNKDSENTKDSGGETKEIPGASSYKSGDETKKESKTSESKDDKKTTSASGSEKTNESKSATKTDKKDSKTKSDDDDKKTTSSSISIDPRDPPGGISLITPASTASTYIKIGDHATFSWKYTSLKVTPKHLDVVAVCSQNSQTVTITTKHPAKDTELVWDTSKAEKNSSINLLTSKYELKMYDSSSNASTTTQRPGYLTPLAYTLGLYRPRSYSPEAGDSSYVNGGVGLVDITAAKWVFSMGIIFAGSALHIILG
ncbi:hypothetical protein TRICI_005901 [Trichomonascus ciferrii]|uniref:DUF7137 domain-containing protein n=1 Tax=Trichomonascus ciferrii TaxID=44093 RepID=A0A642UNC9_9ASCO|nr:hypothetical protein TRICI_005901 [Trichomonascus ciferrii]